MRDIHNYLMFLRDKTMSTIKDAAQLVLLDFRPDKAHFDKCRVFKS